MTSLLHLLAAAVFLLQLVQANPSLPQSFKDSAFSIANSAIEQATKELSNSIKTADVSGQVSVQTTTQDQAVGTPAPSVCVEDPKLTLSVDKSEINLPFAFLDTPYVYPTVEYSTGCLLDVNTKWSIATTNKDRIVSQPGENGTLKNDIWSLQGPTPGEKVYDHAYLRDISIQVLGTPFETPGVFTAKDVITFTVGKTQASTTITINRLPKTN